VARIDHGGVLVDGKHPTGQVAKELLEVAVLPGFADAAGS